MHEMGIATSVLEAVEKETRRYPGHRASIVGLRIGQFAAVDPESLRFCFDVLVKDSDFDPLGLQIESAPNDELDLAFIELEEHCLVGQAFRPAAGLSPGAPHAQTASPAVPEAEPHAEA
jgi:Zn finger protein HypA/HybF involved in hydrogenase expression